MFVAGSLQYTSQSISTKPFHGYRCRETTFETPTVTSAAIAAHAISAAAKPNNSLFIIAPFVC